MGGHGGLNILPQKKWHVFNYDNRIKVELDELHAKEEDSKREETVQKIQSERVFNTLRDILPESDRSLPQESTPGTAEKRGNPEYLKEEKAAKDKVIMRSTMYLGQTVSHQPAPWYTKVQKPEDRYDFDKTKPAEFYSIVPKRKKEQKGHRKVRTLDKPMRREQKLTIEEMRTERLKREATERKKAEQLLEERRNLP